MRPYRVNGQPRERLCSLHWHVHKPPLPEEETRRDSSVIRARNPEVVKRMRYQLNHANCTNQVTGIDAAAILEFDRAAVLLLDPELRLKSEVCKHVLLIRPHCFKHSDRIQQTNLRKQDQWASVFDWNRCQVE